MTRIHQQVSSRQHELWYELCIRCEQRVRRAICVLAMLAVLASLAVAQSTSQLNGSVTDPSGAAVSGAKITLTDPATGLQRTTTSNSAGLYQFLDVPPGEYRLEANASGFASVVVPKVTLLVKLPSTVPLRLQVAGATTSISVEGEAPLINRTDASLGNVVDQDQIAELPIARPQRSESAEPPAGCGLSWDSVAGTADTDTRSGAVNGLRSDQSNVTLDGIGVNDQNNGYAFNSVLNVPPDSVQEFRVTTANSNADSGYSSGAQVALATKSGTNKFHGSAYEYNRNTVFSANDPLLEGVPDHRDEPNKAPKLLYNVFGVTLEGRSRRTGSSSSPTMKDSGRRRGPQRITGRAECGLSASGYLQYLCTLNADGSLNTRPVPEAPSNGLTGVQPGYYALNPSQITGIDPLGIGPSAGIRAFLINIKPSNDECW